MSDDNQQAASTTKPELRREIASVERDIFNVVFYGGQVRLLINGDEVLRTRGGSKGLALYDEIERDCHAGSVLDKRKRAVTAREWRVTPASDAPEDAAVAEFVNDVVATKLDSLTKDLLDATLKGFSVVEVVWDVMDGKIVPTKFIARDQRRFTFDTERNVRLLTREKMMEGEELPSRKFIVHSVGAKDGSPYGRGLGARLFWPVFFKRQNISFWLIFNEKFGSPTPSGQYPNGATDQEKRDLLSSLRSISTDGAVIVPEGFEIKLLEAVRGGGADCYERMCSYMDAEISKAVLGETLTTTVGNTGGNRALGDVHEKVRMEVAKDDADALSETLNNSLVKWLVELNFPGREPPTLHRVFEEEEDLDQLADRDTKLKGLGFERTDESFVETYGEGYQRAQSASMDTVNGEAANAAARPPSVGAPAEAGFAEPKVGLFRRFLQFLSFADDPVASQRQANRDIQQAFVDASDELSANYSEMVGPQFEQLQTLLDETGDLKLFRERLNEMVAQVPNAKAVDSVARARFAAHLQGRVPRV